MYYFKTLQPPLDRLHLDIYPLFTIHPYSKMLFEPQLNNNLIAVGVEYNSVPVGLGIILKNPEKKSAKLVSLFIEEEHRKQKIGSQLLEKLEEALLNQQDSTSHVTCTYPITDGIKNISAPYFEKIILKQKWEIQEKLYGGKIPNSAAIEWLKKPLKLPKGFTLFKWIDLNEIDKKIIAEKKKKNAWHPAVCPYDQSEDIEYLNSLGLRYNGELVGWMITHRIFHGVIQYRALCIDSTFKKSSVCIYLLTEAIRLHVEAYPDHSSEGLFLFKNKRLTGTPGFYNFFEKKLLPYCTTKINLHEASKKLV
jgi:GNAT superfamily N-acetyltransferase